MFPPVRLVVAYPGRSGCIAGCSTARSMEVTAQKPLMIDQNDRLFETSVINVQINQMHACSVHWLQGLKDMHLKISNHDQPCV